MGVPEPLKNELDNRYTFFPVKDTNIYNYYRKAIDSFWRAEELQISKDLPDWEKKLNDDERYFIKHILGFFAGSDGIVIENLGLRFFKEIQMPEVRAFYSFQMAMEAIHSQTYSLLIDTYIRDKREKDKIFNSINNFPAIKQKCDWAVKWIESKNATFATRLVAFAIVEGLFFSGAFCSIFWLKKRGLMPVLGLSNEFISRDEALHTEFAVYLYRHYIKNQLSKNKLHNIIKEAVEIEKEFITEALPVRLIGMNQKLMKEYIEFVADRLTVQLGYEKIYNTGNPFEWMDMISIEGKTNFFERVVSEYALADKSQEEEAFAGLEVEDF